VVSENNKDKRNILRIGLVGCGLIAEHHMRFLAESKVAQVVGLADVNEESARHLGERYGIQNIHGSLDNLLDSTSLDVLHILTPPAYHYAQAMAAIDRRVHVLIEKPVAFRAHEVTDLYDYATANSVSLCPDFTQLFHPKMQQALSIVRSGRLGRVIHVESYLCLDVSMQPELREAMGLRWSYQLPGGILHNYITHPLSLVLCFAGEAKQVSVSTNSHGALPQDLTDHLAIMLQGKRCTASIVLSLASTQDHYSVKILCERGTIAVSFVASSIVVTRKSSLPRSLSRATSDLGQAYQLSKETIKNIIDFARHKLIPYQGLQMLINQYYSSIINSTEPPVARELTVAVLKAEEAVIAQAGKLHLDISNRPSKQQSIRHPEKILVTGATGYVGSQLVPQLVKEGYYVRVLVRALSRTELPERLGCEVVYGDVRQLNDLHKAFEGIDIVVHMAASVRGTSRFILDSCTNGTKNILEASNVSGVKRVIYLSSMSVYDYVKLKNGDIITENSPLEEYPELRGPYSEGKYRAEELALTHLKDESPALTILRPSLIVGRGRDIFSPVGLRLGNVLVCFGRVRKNLRLIHVDDVATAIIQLIQNEHTRGQLFTLSQPEPLTVHDYVEGCIRAGRYQDIRIIHVPFWFAALGVWTIMALRKLTGKGPSMNMRRLVYLYRDVRADSRTIKEQTGWQPRPGLLERLVEESMEKL
jgi:2-alkyl-3-oxoalkanoate reductase